MNGLLLTVLVLRTSTAFLVGSVLVVVTAIVVVREVVSIVVSKNVFDNYLT